MAATEGFGVGTPIEARQSSPGSRSRRPGAVDHPRSLRRFWADADLREALGMPRHSAGQGNGQEADDGGWIVDSAPATTAEGLSAASAPGVPGRTDPDRRQRSSVVRGTGAGLHAAGVCGRCDEPIDDAALHADRIDLQLLRGNADVYRTPWQTGSVLQRQGQRVSQREAGQDWQSRDAIWPGDVRAEHRHVLREQQFGQGTCRASAPDVAGSIGQGDAIARDQHGGRRQRLRALLHGRLQRTLREAAEERLQCTPAAAA